MCTADRFFMIGFLRRHESFFAKKHRERTHDVFKVLIQLELSSLSCEEEYADSCEHNAADDEVNGVTLTGSNGGGAAAGTGRRAAAAGAGAGRRAGAGAGSGAAGTGRRAAGTGRRIGTCGSLPIKGSAGLFDSLLNICGAQTELCSGIVDGLLCALAVELESVVDAVSAGGAEELNKQGVSSFAFPISVADCVTDGGDANGVAVFAAIPLYNSRLLVGVNVVFNLLAGALSSVAYAVGSENEVAGLHAPVSSENTAAVVGDAEAADVNRPETTAFVLHVALFGTPSDDLTVSLAVEIEGDGFVVIPTAGICVEINLAAFAG